MLNELTDAMKSLRAYGIGGALGFPLSSEHQCGRVTRHFWRQSLFLEVCPRENTRKSTLSPSFEAKTLLVLMILTVETEMFSFFKGNVPGLRSDQHTVEACGWG